MKRRLIESIFPIKEISKESSKEKSVRHGHISTLHVWWARRPLASSRTTIYASLVGPPKNIDDWVTKNDLMIKLSKWENVSNYNFIDQIKKEILNNNGGIPPKVLDPFGGGGSIPLEALRLGCETYASDINPVAILIQKCTLEFPQKFGNQLNGEGFAHEQKENELSENIKKWSDWVFDESFNEIGKFYPKNLDMITDGYITARTILCQESKCGVEIPLMNNYWLVRKPNKKIAIQPIVNKKTIQFQIVGNGYAKIPNEFNPDKGTIRRATVVCIACGAVIDPKTLKKIFWKKESWDRHIATVVHKEKNVGKIYNIPNKSDASSFQCAKEYLTIKKISMSNQFEIDPIPDEIILTPDNKEYRPGGLYWTYASIVLYGITKWKDLFNPRQLLSSIVFMEKIRQAHKLMLDSGYDEEYAKVITTYLAIMLNRLVSKNTKLSRYHVTRETIEQLFGRGAFQMIHVYIELNPFTNTGWKNMQEWVLKVVSHCSKLEKPAAKIIQESASSLSHKDDYFDAVFTDPPYYDNIPYSNLSDFFYVWLKRSIGHLYPELFSTPLTPKSNEAITNLSLAHGDTRKNIADTIRSIKTKEIFEQTLSKSFMEIYRVLKKNGVAVIVYAHKSTEGWETLINSILESGLVITGALPISTEMKSRMVAKESAALNSSIYMIATKSEKIDLGFYRDIKKDLEVHVAVKLQRLWGQGISGSDFFISAIGASIEIFARYKKIVDDADRPITAMNLLSDIRKIVTNFAINQVLHDGIDGEVSQLTRFYILWRWAYGYAKIPFDDALKLAQSVGIDIKYEFDRGFIIKEKEFVKILEPSERKIEDLESQELIDVLHKAALYWKNNKQEDMLRVLRVLKRNKIGGMDVFFKVAQAITESNPNSQESKLLGGFLAGRNKIIENINFGSF